MEKVDYDLVIIGGGPAGLTAGLYASRARLNCILVEKLAPGGQVLLTDWIENYPGFPEGISGFELIDKMTAQAKRFGLPIETEEVVSVDFSNPKTKKIHLPNTTLTSHTVIVATGASPRRMGIPGEDAFYGKGVSFCGTCDGPFYRDRVVAAIGGGDTAVQESLFLTKFASKVYLIHRRDKLRATQILQERAFANDRIEFVWDSVAKRINGGNDGVNGVTVENVKTGEIRDIPVDGCFIWIGTLPNTAFLGDALDCDEFGFIVSDMSMETSVSGVFAIGDVRSTPLRQIATSVGDAAVAATMAEHYIQNL